MFEICKYMFFGLRYENTTTTTTDFKGGSFCKFLDHYTTSSTFLKKWTLSPMLVMLSVGHGNLFVLQINRIFAICHHLIDRTISIFWMMDLFFEKKT